jgi:hypothetical protein
MRLDAQQEAIDSFYWQRGPCCAGCDWWASISSVAGSCRKAAPISAGNRAALLGMRSLSIDIGAGHPLTLRDHHCGDFRDDFDWLSLPLAYRKRVGCPIRLNPNPTRLNPEESL